MRGKWWRWLGERNDEIEGVGRGGRLLAAFGGFAEGGGFRMYVGVSAGGCAVACLIWRCVFRGRRDVECAVVIIFKRVEAVPQVRYCLPLAFRPCLLAVKAFAEDDGGLFKFNHLCFQILDAVTC